jgi:mRNA-degrading endonuclease YafQ of YafQ-DinJ toxin-antitoxin module
MAALHSLRHYIDIVSGLFEAKQKQRDDSPWGVSYTPLFAPSLLHHQKKFRDLSDKVEKFIDLKTPNPMANKYGKHDSPFTGPLVGFFHTHLRDDAILIYNLQNRCVNLIMIVNHAEIEGKFAKRTAAKIDPFRS